MPTLPCATHGCAAIVSIDVVAVGRLQLLEEVERAARASGAADVDADGRVAERLRDQRARLRRRRIRGRVAGVLDDGRVRALVGRTGQVHVHREQRAVARPEVAVPVADRLRRVEGRGRRRRPRRSRRPLRSRRVSARSRGDAVAARGRHVAEDEAAVRVGGRVAATTRRRRARGASLAGSARRSRTPGRRSRRRRTAPYPRSRGRRSRGRRVRSGPRPSPIWPCCSSTRPAPARLREDDSDGCA